MSECGKLTLQVSLYKIKVDENNFISFVQAPVEEKEPKEEDEEGVVEEEKEEEEKKPKTKKVKI